MLKRNLYQFFTLIIVFNSLGFNLFARNTSNLLKGDTVPFQNKFTKRTLPNGFTYILYDTDDSTKKTELRFAVRTGSLAEGYDDVEVAHLIEHTAFGATSDHENVMGFLVKEGFSFGGDFTATTGDSHTEYSIRIPAADSIKFNLCLELVRQWCDKIRLDSIDIERDKSSILNEITSGAQDSAKVNILLSDTFFSRRWSSIISSVKKLNHDKVKDFYQKWYRPDLQCLVLVGDFDIGEAQKNIERLFIDLALPVSSKPKFSRDAALKKTDGWIEKEDVGFPYVEITRLLKRRPAISNKDYAETVTFQTFNALAKARLNNSFCDELLPIDLLMQYREKFIMRETGYAALSQFIKIRQGVSGKKRTEALNKSLLFLKQIEKLGFNEQEFQAAKEDVRHQINLEGFGNPASIADRLQYGFVYGDSVINPVIFFRILNNAIDTLSLEYVNATQREWWTDTNVLYITGSRKRHGEMPTESDFSKLTDDLNNTKNNLSGSSSQKNLFPFKKPIRSLGNDIIQEKKEIIAIEATNIQLANGINLILKPIRAEKNQPKTISIAAVKRVGASVNEGKNYFSALHSADIVRFSGIGDIDKTSLDAYLSCKQINEFRIFVNDRSLGFVAEGPYEQLETMLGLICSYIKYPKLSTEGKQNFINYIGRANLQRHNILNSQSNDSIEGTYAGDMSLDKLLNNEIIKQSDLNVAKKFYQDYVQNVDGLTFVISGDFDMEKVSDLLVDYLGQLKSDHKFQSRSTDRKSLDGQTAIQKPVYEIVQDGSSGDRQLSLRFYSPGGKTLRDRLIQKIAANLLRTLLYKKIRWELGSAYFLSVSEKQLLYNHFKFDIYINSKLGNVQQTIDSTWNELQKLSDHGPDSMDLQSSLSQIKSEIEKFYTADPAFWTKYLSEQILYSRDIAEISQWKEVINSIRPNDIQSFVQRLLDYDKKIIINK